MNQLAGGRTRRKTGGAHRLEAEERMGIKLSREHDDELRGVRHACTVALESSTVNHVTPEIRTVDRVGKTPRVTGAVRYAIGLAVRCQSELGVRRVLTTNPILCPVPSLLSTTSHLLFPLRWSRRNVGALGCKSSATTAD